MNSMIDVEQVKEGETMEFDVKVSESGGQTRHRVSMATATYEKLSHGRATPEECIRAAFQFLLEREPKEAILSRFDVTVISRYFPNFEREFPRYLSD